VPFSLILISLIDKKSVQLTRPWLVAKMCQNAKNRIMLMSKTFCHYKSMLVEDDNTLI